VAYYKCYLSLERMKRLAHRMYEGVANERVVRHYRFAHPCLGLPCIDLALDLGPDLGLGLGLALALALALRPQPAHHANE
jgi:hypothetical protein